MSHQSENEKRTHMRTKEGEKNDAQKRRKTEEKDEVYKNRGKGKSMKHTERIKHEINMRNKKKTG